MACKRRNMFNKVTEIGMMWAAGVNNNMLMGGGVCKTVGGLTRSQQEVCLKYPEVTAAALVGLQQAVRECQFQFRWHRWNCSNLSNKSQNPHTSIILKKEFLGWECFSNDEGAKETVERGFLWWSVFDEAIKTLLPCLTKCIEVDRAHVQKQRHILLGTEISAGVTYFPKLWNTFIDKQGEYFSMENQQETRESPFLMNVIMGARNPGQYKVLQKVVSDIKVPPTTTTRHLVLYDFLLRAILLSAFRLALSFGNS
ncbi:hypothetical protein AAG570_000988 [Ranatra chinensis]|uniref:Protein Wnt n=1 Tax=Ranatra chinensis TaxID=642074 RepID=A0ABD0YBB8_9HEMI